jgi:hypothetical protein
MAFILASYKVADYGGWKAIFDEDHAGRSGAVKHHQIFQAVNDSNHVFIGLEFSSAQDASAFHQRLSASGVLEGLTIESAPTVVELADEQTY